jgi:hypothetical protein
LLHIHRNDTVGQFNLEAVLKIWDSSGNRKIHLAITDCHLKLFIKGALATILTKKIYVLEIGK